jgi:hypothetical protein
MRGNDRAAKQELLHLPGLGSDPWPGRFLPVKNAYSSLRLLLRVVTAEGSATGVHYMEDTITTGL